MCINKTLDIELEREGYKIGDYIISGHRSRAIVDVKTDENGKKLYKLENDPNWHTGFDLAWISK